jgi:hypothetical protein
MTSKTKLLLSGGILSVAIAGAYFYLKSTKKPETANSASNIPVPQEEGSVSATNTTQKSVTLPAIPVGSSASGDKAVFNANSGYQKFGTGLIIQFGYSGSTVKFPIPFPNKCMSVSVSTARNSSGARGMNHATNVTKTGFTQVLDGSYGYWIAMGH